MIETLENLEIAVNCSDAGHLSPLLLLGLRPLASEFRDSQEVIGRPHKPTRQLGPSNPSVASAPKSSHGFHPTKNLFDSLASPLAQLITQVPRSRSVDRRSSTPSPIFSHMRRNSPAPQHRHKSAAIISFVSAQRLRIDLLAGLPFQHPFRSLNLGGAACRSNAEIHQQAMTVIHQCVGPITKLRRLAQTPAQQSTLRIGRRLMSRVAPVLAAEIHRRVSRIPVIRSSRWVLFARPKTLQARPSFQQRAVHGEMIVTDQTRLSGLADHGIEKQTADLMLQQSLAILREHTEIKTFFRQFHIQKPTEQKVVVQLLTELPFTSDREKGDQQHRFENSFGRNRRTTRRRVHFVKHSRKCFQLLIRHGLYLA